MSNDKKTVYFSKEGFDNMAGNIITESLADDIITVASAFEKLTTSGLNERAIILLIHDISGVNKRQIKSVLHAAKSLDSIYLNENKKIV